jgi:integrase
VRRLVGGQTIQAPARRLERYAYPLIGTKAVSTIGTDDVVRVLQPIWRTRHITATRLRQRLEQILDYAMTAGHRPEGLNPARWKGHLKHLLPVTNGNRPAHHAAVAWRDMPALMRELAGIETVPAMALRWTILTLARTIETRRALWAHIDRDAAVWTCPPAAMKAGRPHVVPLSTQALTIVRTMEELRTGPMVFPGARGASKLSASAMLKTLQALRPGCTVHGLRAAFRTWVADTRRQDRDLAEHALAHVVEGATELAYQRSDHLEPRRELMQGWADWCCGR